MTDAAHAKSLWAWAADKRRLRAVAVALAALAGAALGGLTEIAPPLRALELRARDALHAALYPPADLSDRVAVVVFTEAELARMAYRSPLDRGMVADVVTALATRGAAAVGIDILFDQPTEPAKDARLRAALTRGDGPPVIVATADTRDGLTPAQVAWMTDFLQDARTGHAAVLRDGLLGVSRMVEGPRVPDPAAELGGAVVPPLSYALAQAVGAPTPEGSLTVAFRRRADDPAATVAPRYPASAAAVLPEAWIRDRIVLIGADLDGYDRHATPITAARGADVAGVFVHAQAIQQLLEGRRLRETTPAVDAAAAALAAALGALAIAAPARAPALRLAAGALGGVAMAAGPAVALTALSLRGPTLTPLAAYALAAGAAGFARWRAEAAARAQLRDAFSRYVAPAVVREIAAAPGALRLGGERREITSVFSDVAGFTTMCETAEPEALSTVLNRYLDGASEIYVRHGATIDKFVGDAVVGFVGAPVAQADHARAAVALLLDLDRFACAFAQEPLARALGFGGVRVGAHSGPATVGNFGGARFFDYTAMGDTINTAARLEGANKAFGTRICVSGQTWEQARAADPTLRGRPICDVVLKGRAGWITVWEPLQPAADDPDSLIRASDSDYADAYAALRREDPGAVAMFELLSRRWPCDPLIRFHAARLAQGAHGVCVRLFDK